MTLIDVVINIWTLVNLGFFLERGISYLNGWLEPGWFSSREFYIFLVSAGCNAALVGG